MICARMADASPSSPAETLAWESANRTRAGLLALIAGNLTLFGSIAASVVYSDMPKVGVLDGIRDAAGEKLVVGDGLRTPALFFYDDKAVPLLIIAAVLAIGSAAMAPALGYLFRATQARTRVLPRVALYGALVGPILAAVAQLVLQIAISIKAHDFVGSKDHSTGAAHDALSGGAVVGAQILQQASILLVAFSFVLIALNAMRVGLLTRFMGILGMLVGVLFIIPLGSNLPVVQCFWLIALGFLILDRWPGPAGRPPAWSTGEPEPWPTQQEVREQREAAAAAARGEEPPAEEPRAVAAGPDVGEDGLPGTPARRPESVGHPSSKKRKNRKRR